MHFSSEGNFNETRWVPFPEPIEERQQSLALNAGDEEGWKFGKIDKLPLGDMVPEEAWAGAPVDWTLQLRTWTLEHIHRVGDTSPYQQPGPEWDWAKGRVVLFIGECDPSCWCRHDSEL